MIQANKPIKKLLFVCTGNVCRSVMAEYLLKKMADDSGSNGIEADSCGIAASANFSIPDPILQELSRDGIDASAHKPKTPDEKIVGDSDIILTMERHQYYIMLNSFPKAKEKIFIFKTYLGASGDPNIHDPIGGDAEKYKKTYGEIKKYTEKLYKKILSGGAL